MQFEYDPERLIEEVEKRPALWNFTDVNYKSMAARVTMWNEVVASLLDPGVRLKSGETRELVAQLQKKWKSLKDSYIKYLQNPNAKRPYIYSRHLNFLHVNRRLKEAENDSGSDHGRAKKRKKRPETVVVKIEEDTSEEDADNSNASEENHYVEIPSILPDVNGKNQNASKPEEFAFANVETIVKNDAGADDCDKMFLMSLLPHLKSIPEENRLAAKMRLLEVLQSANSAAGVGRNNSMI